MTIDHHRPLHLPAQSLGDLGRVDPTVDEHDELVATEASETIGVTHHVTQPARHLTEQFVADTVAEAVVDHLEVVEVDEEHRHLTRHRSGEQRVESLHERRPVREFRQVVVGRRVRESLGCDPLVGDVLDVGDRERNALVLGHRHAGTRPHELAVTAQVALLQEIGLGDSQFEPGALCCGGTQIVGMRDLANPHPDQRIERPVEHVGQRLVGVDDPAVVEPDEGHTGRRRMERLLETPARLFEGDGAARPVGDVAQQHHESAATAAVVHRRSVQRRLDEMGIAVRVDQFEQDVIADRAGHVEGLGHRVVESPSLGDDVTIRIADHLEERPTHQFVHRATGEQGGAPVGRLDDPVRVEPHDRIGKIVEESPDLTLRAFQFVDRAAEPVADPS